MNQDQLKNIIASNIIELRSNMGMTQSELAEKINYSDKSISKWETAKAIPDVAVLKSIADAFGITIDDLIKPHDQWQDLKTKQKQTFRYRMIIGIAIMSIWAIALLLFIIFWLLGRYLWIIFLSALPISLVTLLVLHSIWGKGKYNVQIISALMLSIIVLIYFIFIKYNWWQLFLLAIPFEAIIIFCFHIKRPQKK